MARKTTKKRVTKTATAKRKTAKKAPKAASKKSPPKPAERTTVSRAIDLLRGWSPSRYSPR